MVCFNLVHGRMLVQTFQLVERRIRRDGWNTFRNFPTDEQHGCTAGVSLAMVFCLSDHRLLVFHDCVVASTVNYTISLLVFFCFFLQPHKVYTEVCPSQQRAWLKAQIRDLRY